MAITFKPIIKDYIVYPYMQLLRKEFNPIPTNMDDPGGKESFSIVSAIDNIIGLGAGKSNTEGTKGGAWKADYEIKTIYDFVAGGSKDRESIMFELMNIAERTRQLIDNWRDFSVPIHWIDPSTMTWGTSNFIWEKSQSRYCWNRGRIENIDYEQPADLKQNHYQVSMLFKCFRETINVN